MRRPNGPVIRRGGPDMATAVAAALLVLIGLAIVGLFGLSIYAIFAAVMS